MAVLALTATQAFTPLETIKDAAVLIEDGVIRSIGPRREVVIPPGARTVDLGDKILAPGFVDVHIHGAAGHDVMEATPEALEAVAAFVFRHGTTSFLPTTLSAPSEVLLPSLEGLGKAIRSWKGNRGGSHGTIAVPWAGVSSKAPLAEPLGIHLEGPFLSTDCRGVHPREHLQPPSLALFHQMLAAAGGAVRILTLAPELEGAAELQAAAIRKGVRVAIGHSNASYEQALAAINSGAAHAVHVFNAMRPFAHRDPGILGAILIDDRILAEVIADGVHVAAPALRLLLRSKSPARIALVTDGVSATGTWTWVQASTPVPQDDASNRWVQASTPVLQDGIDIPLPATQPVPPGHFSLGGMDIFVTADPHTGQLACRNREGKLAGSVLTLDRAVQNMIRLAGVTLREAVLMASYVPAQMAGVANRKGALRPGADADLVVLHPDGTVAGAMAHGTGNFL